MKTRKFKVKNGIGGTWVTLQGTTKHEVQTTRDRENRETLKSIVTVCAIGSKLLLSPEKKKRIYRWRAAQRRREHNYYAANKQLEAEMSIPCRECDWRNDYG